MSQPLKEITLKLTRDEYLALLEVIKYLSKKLEEKQKEVKK